ncbi:hypothetical protein F5Y18DRAFT_10406 [Xylariaceae sp. FL1019]|nr:hypothetical protein F5Y18DRAFT_10406 [Xylariaceae sp. FL1019]
MLCAICLSMFHNDRFKGLHHNSFEHLKKAAEGGCKICISLLLRRKELGADPETEGLATPFLVYRLSVDILLSQSQGIILFDSQVAWLRFAVPWDTIVVDVSDNVELPESWYLKVLQHAKDDIHNQPWLVRKDLFPSRAIPGNMGHIEVLNLAGCWFRGCSQNHKCETLNGTTDLTWCPKRLIDLSNLDSPPRLLERQSELPNGRYAALSHCWGDDSDFVVLSADNLDQFRRALPPDLPQSFLDAIAICRHLGIPYLWNDCICIIQCGKGSEEDWLFHTNEMALVYLNCCLNLSFDSAVGPKTGVFSDRNADFIQPCYIYSSIFHTMWRNTLPDFNDDSTTESETESSEEDTEDEDLQLLGRGQIPEPSAFYHEPAVPNGRPLEPAKRHRLAVVSRYEKRWNLRLHALQKRGWALQESLLAPRILHFTEYEISWECGENPFLTEAYPMGITKSPSSCQGFGYDFNLPLQQHYCCRAPLSNAWAWLVLQYTIRNLRYPEKDKLAAFSAIAQRFSAIFGEEYYAGHFLSLMPMDLVWAHNVKQVSNSPKAKVNRRFPTWSWTSVDGEVRHMFHSHYDCETVALSRILDVQVDLVDQAYKYGPVRSGRLRIRGLLLRCSVSGEASGFYGTDRKCELSIEYNDDRKHTLSLELRVDPDRYGEKMVDEFYALPLVQFQSQDPDACHVSGGICLRPSSQDVTTFERVGSFKTAIDSSWEASNIRAFESDKQLTDFCRIHGDFERVIEII